MGLSSAFLAAPLPGLRRNPDEGGYLCPPWQNTHASGWRLRRSVRAGRVLLERNQLLRPGLEHGSDHAPGLLGLVGSDRQSGVPRENVEKQLRVRRQLGWFEMGCEGEWHERAGPRAGTAQL